MQGKFIYFHTILLGVLIFIIKNVFISELTHSYTLNLLNTKYLTIYSMHLLKLKIVELIIITVKVGFFICLGEFTLVTRLSNLKPRKIPPNV